MSMHRLGEVKKKINYEVEVDSETQRRRVKQALIRCMREYQFYGTIVLTLNIKEVAEDSWIKTVATDGTYLFYNKHFIAALSTEEILFIMAHEVLHLVLKHLTRKGSRTAKRWNAAGDYVINAMLVEAGVGRFPEIGGLYDPQFKEMTTERVYDNLPDDQGEGNGAGESGNFDQHIDVSEGSGSGDGESQQSIQMSKDQMTEMEEDMDSKLIQAMNNARNSGQAGSVPMGVQRLIDDLTTSRVPWHKLMREMAASQIKSDYTYKRINPRYLQMGVVMPTLDVERHFEFTVGLDTSGSISNKMLSDFLAEIYNISRTFRSFKVKVFQYDTKVYAEKDFDQNNIEEILEYEIKGGGGTCYDAAYDYFKKINHKPKVYFNFTDGFPWNSWGDEEYCKTIFVIHDDHAISTRVTAPFGQTVYYSEFQ